MPKTHASDTAKIVYRIKPPAVWRAIRAEWEAGAIPVDLARRYDVSASSVQARRDREGWSRDAMLDRLGAPQVGLAFASAQRWAGPTPSPSAPQDAMGAGAADASVASPSTGSPDAKKEDGACGAGPGGGAAAVTAGGPLCIGDVTAQAIVDTALLRALEALAQGRAGDAVALIKAGDAVGAFADFAARLRRGETGGVAPVEAGGGEAFWRSAEVSNSEPPAP